jgi:hypothetical protein
MDRLEASAFLIFSEVTSLFSRQTGCPDMLARLQIPLKIGTATGVIQKIVDAHNFDRVAKRPLYNRVYGPAIAIDLGDRAANVILPSSLLGEPPYFIGDLFGEISHQSN